MKLTKGRVPKEVFLFLRNFLMLFPFYNPRLKIDGGDEVLLNIEKCQSFVFLGDLKEEVRSFSCLNHPARRSQNTERSTCGWFVFGSNGKWN